jgi:WD40 repeat protein
MRRLLSLALLLSLGSAAAWGLFTGPDRQEVPAAADVERSLKVVRKIYADEYARAAKSVPERRALALALQKDARSAKESAPLYFATLKEAADVAAEAGDTDLAFEVISELAGAFAVDAGKVRADVLAQASGKAAEAAVLERLGESALRETDAAFDRDDFAAARRLIAAAEVCGKKSDNAQLKTQAKRSAAQLDVLQKEYTAVMPHLERLKKNPKDPQANLAVGRYLALGKNNWDKGLPHFVLGSDATLKALAERDLAKPAKANDQLALGDAWWDLAEKEKDPAQRNLQRRAAYWYGLAYPELTGINKVKVEKRHQTAGLELPMPKVAVGLVRTFQGHTRGVQAVAISPDGRYLVSGGDDDELRYWELATGNQVKSFKGHANQVWSVAFGPEGKTILSGAEDLTARLWDVEKGKEIRQLTGHTDAVNRVALTFDGKRALSAGDDKLVIVWDVESGKQLKKLEGHAKAVWGAAFSKDGSRVVSGGLDNICIVWDTKSGEALKKFEGHTDGVLTVAVAPDGKHAVSAGKDGIVRYWEMETGKELRRFEGHTGTVYSVALSADGRRLLTAGQDKTVRLWDVVTTKEIHSFAEHTDEVSCVAFSQDGRYAASASIDQTVRLWGLPK